MIYFIEAVGADAVKVGYTAADSRGQGGKVGVEARLAGLRTGCPFPLRVLKLVEGGPPTEKKLHRMWAAHRLEGEWFRLSAIAKDLASITADIDEPSTTCAGCGKTMIHKTTIQAERTCRECQRKAVEAREAALKCVDCGAQLRRGHRRPSWTGRCHPCGQRNRARVAHPCARCGTQGADAGVRLYSKNEQLRLCVPCIAVVREERAAVRRAKQSAAMRGNLNAVGRSARGKLLLAA
jgi:Meiotically Up-regulated Gene 113 (MUG113) protein